MKLNIIVMTVALFLFSLSVDLNNAEATQPSQVPQSQPTSAPASQASSRPVSDILSRLKVIYSKDQLGPTKSVRPRRSGNENSSSKAKMISVRIETRPSKAAIYFGRKLLGYSPFRITAPEGSTPYDVVIKRKGYMALHTRIRREENRSYFFKLTPSKIR